MTLRTFAASALVLLLGTTAAVAQQQTGEIYGKAADTSGAVLPGATVTVAGPALIQPRVAVTSETGTYRVPELPIGTYSVTFELAGFRSLALQDIRVTIGFRAQVNGALELSTVQETVTVTGESPLVDTREIVEAFRETLIDRIMLCARHFDHVTEGSEVGAGERFDRKCARHGDSLEMGCWRTLAANVGKDQKVAKRSYVGDFSVYCD